MELKSLGAYSRAQPVFRHKDVILNPVCEVNLRTQLYSSKEMGGGLPINALNPGFYTETLSWEQVSSEVQASMLDCHIHHRSRGSSSLQTGS